MARFELIDYDPRYFCNRIKIDSNGLIKWDSAGGISTLLVSVPFGLYKRDDLSIYNDICDILNTSRINLCEDSNFIPVGNKYQVMLVSSKYRTINGGVRLFLPGRGYLVMGIIKDGGVLKINSPKLNDYSVYTESKLKINYNVSLGQISIGESGFMRRPEMMKFYTIELSSEFEGGYENGQAVYRIGDVRVPITRDMMQNGIIYLRDFGGEMSRPVVESNSPQVEIVIAQKNR